MYIVSWWWIFVSSYFKWKARQAVLYQGFGHLTHCVDTDLYLRSDASSQCDTHFAKLFQITSINDKVMNRTSCFIIFDFDVCLGHWTKPYSSCSLHTALCCWTFVSNCIKFLSHGWEKLFHHILPWSATLTLDLTRCFMYCTMVNVHAYQISHQVIPP